MGKFSLGREIIANMPYILSKKRGNQPRRAT